MVVLIILSVSKNQIVKLIDLMIEIGQGSFLL